MSKYNFFDYYVGPRGPHLANLTQYSRTKEDNKGNKSIHARSGNYTGKQYAQDKNGNQLPICAPRNPNRKGTLAKASARLDIRRRVHAALSPSAAIAYRQPGSMKW